MCSPNKWPITVYSETSYAGSTDIHTLHTHIHGFEHLQMLSLQLEDPRRLPRHNQTWFKLKTSGHIQGCSEKAMHNPPGKPLQSNMSSHPTDLINCWILYPRGGPGMDQMWSSRAHMFSTHTNHSFSKRDSIQDDRSILSSEPTPTRHLQVLPTAEWAS